MKIYSILTPVFKLAFILMMASGFAACANTQHTIFIEPELYIKPVNLGKGNKVNLKVVDGRPQFAVFNRKTAPKLGFGGSLNTVTIVPDSNISDPIYSEVHDGLRQLGFRPARGVKLERSLVINVVQLKMNYRHHVSEARVHARLKTAIRIIAKNGKKKYKNIYKSNMEKSSRILVGKFKNEQFVNNGLSLALQKMFEDKKLWFFLSQ